MGRAYKIADNSVNMLIFGILRGRGGVKAGILIFASVR